MKNLFIPILLLLSFNTYSFKLTPMSYSIIGGAAKKNIANFTVSNDSDSPIAVQLEVKVRNMLKDGSEKLPETEDFLVFPDQIVLAAKSRRVVKVRWTKGEVKDVERSFRLIAEQLPIDMNKKKDTKTDIKILLRYVAALYVTPEKTSEGFKVASSAPVKGSNKVSFTLENVGNVHIILDKAKVYLEQEGKQFSVTSLEGILGENLLASSKRVFSVIAPKLVNTQKPFKVIVHNE
jgi:fimbrial chaperone protein